MRGCKFCQVSVLTRKLRRRRDVALIQYRMQSHIHFLTKAMYDQ